MRTNQLTDTRGKWSWCYRFAVIQCHPWPFSNKLFLFFYGWSCMIFLQATKLNCQNVTFSPMQTRCSSPMKTIQEFKFIAFVNIFFTDLGSKEKKNCFEHRTMKKRRKGCVKSILSEFVKTFMITQNKGDLEWPTCLALTSVTEQFSN